MSKWYYYPFPSGQIGDVWTMWYNDESVEYDFCNLWAVFGRLDDLMRIWSVPIFNSDSETSEFENLESFGPIFKAKK